MRNWNSYTQKLREAQSRGKGEGTFSGEGVTSQVAQIEKDFEALPMFSRQDHGHRTRGSEDIPDILSPFTDPAWENLPWYAKAAQAGSYMTDKLGDHKDSIVEGVKGMFGSGQIDETDDPFSSENVIRIYRQTGDHPAHITGYNRQQASPSMFDNPIGGYLSDAERLLKNTIPYWEHKESKYSDIYKLIGEGE